MTITTQKTEYKDFFEVTGNLATDKVDFTYRIRTHTGLFKQKK